MTTRTMTLTDEEIAEVLRVSKHTDPRSRNAVERGVIERAAPLLAEEVRAHRARSAQPTPGMEEIERLAGALRVIAEEGRVRHLNRGGTLTAEEAMSALRSHVLIARGALSDARRLAEGERDARGATCAVCGSVRPSAEIMLACRDGYACVAALDAASPSAQEAPASPEPYRCNWHDELTPCSACRAAQEAQAPALRSNQKRPTPTPEDR